MEEFKELSKEDVKPNTWYAATSDYLFFTGTVVTDTVKYICIYNNYTNLKSSKLQSTSNNCFYKEGGHGYKCRLATDKEIQLLIDKGLNEGITLTSGTYEIY